MKKNLRRGFWGVLALVLMVGCSPKLHVAAERGNVQCIEEILLDGENINKRDYHGLTALHYAAQGGQRSIIDLLLNKGAEIDARGNRGETPLYVATYYCHGKVVRALLEKGANVANRFKTNSGLWLAPLLIASGNGCDPTILKDLLKAGADANEIEKWYRYNPLIFASATGNLQAVEVLLSAGVAVNHQSNDGLTGLIGAAIKGSKEIVQILLAAGADPTIRARQRAVPLHKELESNDTALLVAKRRGHSEVVELLEAAEGVKNLH